MKRYVPFYTPPKIYIPQKPVAALRPVVVAMAIVHTNGLLLK